MSKSFLFLFVLMLSGSTVFSQIIYTDIVPDTVLTGLIDINGDSYFLDMDNNGTDDFELVKVTGPFEFGYIQAGGITPQTNAVMTSTPDVAKLNTGDPINSGQSFDVVSNGNFILVSVFMTTVSGQWGGLTEGYMGVRFDSLGSTFYGWVRIGINANNTELTILDYAYQSNGGSINAGEMLTSCIAPSNLMSASVTYNAADISWTENNNATEWQIEYGTTGFSQGTGTVVTITNNPNTISGLTNNTSYDYYVRSICGVGDTSTWAGAGNFQTLIDNVGFFDMDDNDFVSVFPNPNAGQFMVHVDLNLSDVDFVVFNLLGEIVFYSKDLGNGSNAMDLGFLQHGNYVYRLTSEQLNATGKIVIGK